MASSSAIRPRPRAHEVVPNTEGAALEDAREVTVKTGVLCAKCQPIQSWLDQHKDFAKGNQIPESRNQDQLRTGAIRKVEHDHGSGIYLQASSDGGCHLCTLMWSALIEHNPKWNAGLVMTEAVLINADSVVITMYSTLGEELHGLDETRTMHIRVGMIGGGTYDAALQVCKVKSIRGQ